MPRNEPRNGSEMSPEVSPGERESVCARQSDSERPPVLDALSVHDQQILTVD